MSEHDGVHVTRPSIWPVTLAAGVSLLLFGLLVSLAMAAVGAAVMVWALAGWIGELRHG
jgi:hypothetical protein